MNRSLMAMVVLAVLGVVVLQVTLSGLQGLAEERQEKPASVESVVTDCLEARLLGAVTVEESDTQGAPGQVVGRDLVVTATLSGSFAPRAVATDLLDTLHQSFGDFGERTRSVRLVLNPDSPKQVTLEAELPWQPARRFVGDPVKSLPAKPGGR